MSKLGGNIMKCKKCGQEVDKKAVVCTACGCKIKKPIYKRWWFWVLIVVVVAIVGGTSSDNETPTSTSTTTQKEAEEIAYEVVDLQTMFDALDSNAMKAEKIARKTVSKVMRKVGYIQMK